MNLVDVIEGAKAERGEVDGGREGGRIGGVQSYIYQQKLPMRADKRGREPVSIAWLETEHLLGQAAKWGHEG